MVLPYVINRKLEWDGISEMEDNVFPHEEDGNWRLMLFEVRDVKFYLSFSFSATRKSFIIYILIGDRPEEAEKYRAKIWVETYPTDPGVEKSKLGFLQGVVSIEETVDDLEEDLPNSKYLVIPYSEMKNFFSITKNAEDSLYPEENGKWTVVVPIQVQDIINVT